MSTDYGDVARERDMNRTEQSNPRLEIIWKFVRGDMESADFEQWLYSEPGLEEQLGNTLYLDTISADYSCKRKVYEIRISLEVYAREASNLRCECITLPDLADVDMGEASDIALRTFEERATRGDPFWWLAAGPMLRVWTVVARGAGGTTE